LQSWAADVISILREAHQTVEEARARGDTALDPEQLEKLRQQGQPDVSLTCRYSRCP
jgi:hypothetical protein